MLTSNNHIKLIDFGLACVGEFIPNPPKELPGIINPDYAAPEVTRAYEWMRMRTGSAGYVGYDARAV